MTFFALKQATYDLGKQLLAEERRNQLKLGVVAVRSRVGAGSRPLPSFLVIGAMRSGTSSLYKYLDDHPQTAASLRKEIGYFTTQFDRGIDWYRAHFPVTRQRLAFEATPTYLSHPLAPERVRRVLPEARLVVVLRDPLERAWSHYTHRTSRGREERPFLEVVAAEAAGLRQGVAWDPQGLTSDAYLSWSLYGHHLERWLRVHPPERIHVMFSEQLYVATAQTLAELGEFLGIAPGRFGRSQRNFSRPNPDSGGIGRQADRLADELPAEVRAVLDEDRARLADLLGRLPSAAAWPRWMQELGA